MQQLEAPASEFLPWLSRINTRVVNDTDPARHSDLDHLRGGSRNEPTFFIHHCKYETDGCTFSTTSGPSLTYHENTCTPACRETEAHKTLQLACDIPACKYIVQIHRLGGYAGESFDEDETAQKGQPRQNLTHFMPNWSPSRVRWAFRKQGSTLSPQDEMPLRYHSTDMPNRRLPKQDKVGYHGKTERPPSKNTLHEGQRTR